MDYKNKNIRDIKQIKNKNFINSIEMISKIYENLNVRKTTRGQMN